MNELILKDIVETDFVNYKKPSMFLIFPKCSFKCGDKECQNYQMSKQKDIEINIIDLLKMYDANPITASVVCGGLEPLDTQETLVTFISAFRLFYPDDIVIYTGYTEEEVKNMVYGNFNLYNYLMSFPNIIIKFGRYIPNHEPHYDEILGVKLASDNQYAIRSEDNENQVYRKLSDYFRSCES